jgi:hypothetical protein
VTGGQQLVADKIARDHHDVGMQRVHARDDLRQPFRRHVGARHMDVGHQQDACWSRSRAQAGQGHGVGPHQRIPHRIPCRLGQHGAGQGDHDDGCQSSAPPFADFAVNVTAHFTHFSATLPLRTVPLAAKSAAKPSNRLDAFHHDPA